MPDADDNRHVCPNCGHDCLDGQGHFVRTFRRLRGHRPDVHVTQEWYQMRCPDCDQTFGIVNDETTEPLDDE